MIIALVYNIATTIKIHHHHHRTTSLNYFSKSLFLLSIGTTTITQSDQHPIVHIFTIDFLKYPKNEFRSFDISCRLRAHLKFNSWQIKKSKVLAKPPRNFDMIV
jgi:hypothetical protein